MPSITAFRDTFNRHGGALRQHRWRVNLKFPTAVATSDETRDASILGLSTTTPKSVLGEILIPWGGREFPNPGDRKFEPWNITFIGVEDDFHHTLFEAWSEQFNGSESNTAAGEFTDNYADIEIELLDKNDNVIKTYVLEDAWPQEVGELNLDQTAQDSYGQFNVILRYFKARNARSR